MIPKCPFLAVDCTVFDSDGRLLLVQRRFPPFEGAFALPGGYVEVGETTEQAAARELQEETGLEVKSMSLIGVYSDPTRNPGRHVISIAYAVTTMHYDPIAGDDARTARFYENWRNLELAFDHRQMVFDALAKR